MSDKPAALTMPVTIEQIQELLPHRYPFLLVDRVIEIVPDVSVVALKNVSINEPFFQGHFPRASGDAWGVDRRGDGADRRPADTDQGSRMKGNTGSPLFYLVKVDNARFSAVVSPGDQLRMEVGLKRLMRGMGIFVARTLVDGKEVASCELMCAARSDK